MKKFYILFLLLALPLMTQAARKPCYDFKTNLAPGYKNMDVWGNDLIQLKSFLRERGYLGDPKQEVTYTGTKDEIDTCRSQGSLKCQGGYRCDLGGKCRVSQTASSEYVFDKDTEIALSKFQKKYGLQGLGMLGPKTRKVIKNLTCPTIPVTAEVEKAQDVLLRFYSLVSAGRYQEAVVLTDFKTTGKTDEEEISWWKYIPYSCTEYDKTGKYIRNLEGKECEDWDKPHKLESYCRGSGTCLKIKKIVDRYKDNSDYAFKVQLTAKNGQLFKHGPCCGATGKPSTEFTFRVRKINGQYKVIDPPIYTP